MITKLFSTSIEKGAKPRSFTFRVSTGERDRDNDRIPPSSWDLSQFRANPIILWGHRHEIPPIGRAVDVWIDGKHLKATIEFPPPGLHPLADTVAGLVGEGFLKATSVGFKPHKTAPNEFGGLDFQFPVELLEISVVNLPANPGALLERYDHAACMKWLRPRKDSPMLNPMLRFKPDDVVLHLRDAPRTKLSPLAEKFWAMRRAQARGGAKRELIRTLRAVLPGNVLGRGIYLDNPELRHCDRWLPVARWPM